MQELLSNNYLRIIFSTLIIYLFIVIAIRLFGKKELDTTLGCGYGFYSAYQ